MTGRDRWIGLVALADASPAPPEDVVAELATWDGGAPGITSRTSTAFTAAWSAEPAATLNATLVDRPIPWEQLEGPCATAWYWPDAERVLRGHKAHLFVTLLDESRERVAQATRLTRVLAALSSATPGALAIVWGASGAVHEPAAFAELARASSPEHLPLNLWIDFRLYQRDPLPGGEPGGFGLFTTGLEALGRQELEAPEYFGDPQRLVGAVYNVAHYVLEKQTHLRDAEVIGLPDGGEVTVREDRSMVDPDQEVLRLEIG